MSERNSDRAFCGSCESQAVCIHTNKIFDACIDKDCVEDLRVFLTRESQNALENATSVKVRCADLLHVYLDVEPIAYKRGYYTLDLTFYYRIIGDAFPCQSRPVTICGMSVFTKRVILYGGCGTAKVFTSRTKLNCPDQDSIASQDVPEAVVEAVDPMVLSFRLRDVCEDRCHDCDSMDIPPCICKCFEGELVTGSTNKRLYVTLGQFSTIRLERDAQMRVNVLDFCIPEKECCDDPGCEEDPCELFSRISFPMDAFFPCNNSGNCPKETCCDTQCCEAPTA